jgi:hypothetical protein
MGQFLEFGSKRVKKLRTDPPVNFFQNHIISRKCSGYRHRPVSLGEATRVLDSVITSPA